MWEATSNAEAPAPSPDPPFLAEAATRRLRPAPAPEDLPAGTTVRKVTNAASYTPAGVHYTAGSPYGFQQGIIIVGGDKITVADLGGEILIEIRPASTRRDLCR